MSNEFYNPFLPQKPSEGDANKPSEQAPALSAQPAAVPAPTDAGMPAQGNPFQSAPQMPAAQQGMTQQSSSDDILSPMLAASPQMAPQPSPLPPSPQPSPKAMAPQYAAPQQSAPSAPNPFDFANQNGASGGGTSGGQAGGGYVRYRGLSFRGGIGEYYKIVIVNALLTLITFGIYAPWAKVRKQRYFFSNTNFIGDGLQYLATGKQLFIGRIVAIFILIGLSLSEFIPILGGLITFFALLFGLPYVLNRSVGFNARNLAWRDVRFGWDGTFGMAFLVWFIYPLLSFFTLGLAQPLAARALRRHYAENHSFGGARFSADLGLGAFYLALIKSSVFMMVLSVLLVGSLGFIAYTALRDVFVGVTSYDSLMLVLALLPEEQQILLILPVIALALTAYLSAKYYFALVRHIMINALRLEGGIKFRSNLSAFRYAMIIITNLLINIVTLGFAHPYTVVRHYSYLTQAIEVRPVKDMAGFVDAQARAGFSVFEEISDIEGLSIDL